jgi:hypothetical protein
MTHAQKTKELWEKKFSSYRRENVEILFALIVNFQHEKKHKEE